MRKPCAAMLLALLVSSCASVRVYDDKTSADPAQAPKVSTYKTVLLGWKRLDPPIVLENECPQGWREIHTYKDWKQTLLTLVTLNIYGPWTVELTCGSQSK